jgi:hypothetical protein
MASATPVTRPIQFGSLLIVAGTMRPPEITSLRELTLPGA